MPLPIKAEAFLLIQFQKAFLLLWSVVRVAHTFTLIFRQRYKNLLDDTDLSKEIIKFVGIKTIGQL